MIITFHSFRLSVGKLFATYYEARLCDLYVLQLSWGIVQQTESQHSTTHDICQLLMNSVCLQVARAAVVGVQAACSMLPWRKPTGSFSLSCGRTCSCCASCYFPARLARQAPSVWSG